MGYEASASARIGVIVSLPCAHKKLIADKKKQKSKNDTKKQKLNDDAEAKEASEFDHEEVEALAGDLRKFIAPICKKHGVKFSVGELHADVEDARAQSALLIGINLGAYCSVSGRENYGSEYEAKKIPVKVVSDKEEAALKEILSALDVPFTELPLSIVAEVSTG